jgi:hypothetical protein
VWVTIAFVAVLVVPAVRDHDSFPLSTYPMYASDRGRVATLYTAIGRRGPEVKRLGTAVVADTDDPLVAHSSVRDAVLSGRAAELCVVVAARAEGVERVEVVSERVDVVEWAAGSKETAVLDRHVHAACDAR